MSSVAEVIACRGREPARRAFSFSARDCGVEVVIAMAAIAHISA
jgi:hypothetical protein